MATMRNHYDAVIRGGMVVDSHLSRLVDIGIKNGKIAAHLPPLAPAEADRELDATGHYVMPGGIDTHTHALWPFEGGQTDDGFDGAGQSAALGGTTTMVDFVPPLAPGQRLIEAALDRVAKIERSAPINVGLHPILNRFDAGVMEDIQGVIEVGMTSFKMFTTYEDNRVDDGEIWSFMNEISRHGGLPGFHAENHELIQRVTSQLAQEGKVRIRDFPATRPGIAESTMIDTLSEMAAKIGTPIYIFHVSGSEALDAVRNGQKLGVDVYAETCTHYLTLDESVFERPDPWKYVIAPPIRSVGDQRSLWDGIINRSVVSVGSDHCSYPVTSKRAHSDDHRLIQPGAAGIQHRTPILWNEAVNRRGFTPEQFVDISSTRAARTLGMYPDKGSVDIGSDADLIVFSPNVQWDGTDLAKASSNTFNIYEGYAGTGLPRYVFSRGLCVVDEFAFCGSSEAGGFVKRRKLS